MDNAVSLYGKSALRATRVDRNLARQAKATYDDLRLAAFKVDGTMALARHMMEGIVEVDAHRRMLAGDDPITNSLLAEIEVTAVDQCRAIQARLFKPSLL